MKKVSLLGVLFLSMTACQNNSKEALKKEEVKNKVAAETVHESKEVTLDNGKLWVANPETTEGIRNMQKIISERKPDESPAVLKEALEVEFEMIFEKCTMEGEAHNQLHNYLLPLKMKLNQLGGENDQEVITQIDAHLKKYTEYFK